VKTFTGLRRKAIVIKRQLFLQPMIPCDEGTLRRLAGSSHQLIGKELTESGFQLRLRIGLSIRGQEEPRVILLAGVASQEVFTIVQQEMPLPLFSQLSQGRTADEILNIGRRRGLGRPRGDFGDEETQEYDGTDPQGRRKTLEGSSKNAGTLEGDQC